MATTKRGKRIALAAGCIVLALGGLISTIYLRSWYVFWNDFEGLGKNAQGYSEYRHRKTGMVFVWLPGRVFLMGSPDTEDYRMEDEGPLHRITLSPFLIAKHEVSQAEWVKVMGNDSSHGEGDAVPVVEVSWGDCQEFCEKSGFSLPTEAQWEYACRAGTDGPFGGTGKLDDMGWHGQNARSRPHPVGERAPNNFGLHDMHGNVWEWCEDWFDEEFYEDSAGSKRPLCKDSDSAYRVARGGSVYSQARSCRSAYRFRYSPEIRSRGLGFRPTAPSP